MVHGAILNKGEQYYTDLGRVFAGISDEQLELNWLVTDCVCYPEDKKLHDMFLEEYTWLTGEELTEIVRKQPFQWIWAVLSGFEKDVKLEDILRYPLPSIQDNNNIFYNPLAIQHPLAKVEILPWDSTSTILLSKNPALVSKFLEAFPLSEDMAEYNNRLRGHRDD